MVTLFSIGSLFSSYAGGGSGQGTAAGSGHGTADDSGGQAANGGVPDALARASTDRDGNAAYD
jgi:hypothetical protein